MEDYYEYLDSNGVTTLYKLIKDDTVALIDSYSVTINGITTTLDTHINNMDIHTPISDIENMVDTKISGLVNSAPETLDTLKELADALGNDSNFATTVVNQIDNKASKDSVYTKEETDTLLEGKANKSDLSTVATSGSYKDLLDKPVIPEGSDLSDYYNKGETDNLLNSKANTSDLAVVAKSGNYNDLNNTPTIPTRTSQLINDSGFLTSSSGVITSVSWSDITDKPNFATVATSGSYTDLSNTPTIPTKVSQLENDMGFGTGGDTSDCVHKTGDETISGNKTFTNQMYLGSGGTGYGQISAKDNNSILRLFGGTSAGTGANLDLYGEGLSSGGFSLRARTSDKIVGLDGKVDGTLKWNGKNIALDENLVHRTGDEYINGNKIFSDTIHRYADLTTVRDVQVYRFVDTNANACGHIYNNVHWHNNDIYNTHGAYNAKSGKIMQIDINSHDTGVGRVYISGTASNGNLETVISATDYPAIATMGWVNNPATSTNVVHRSGNETIKGVKYFDSLVYLHNNMSNKNSQMDLFTTPANTLYAHYMFVDKNDEITAYMQYGQQNSGTDFIGLFIHDKNRALHGLQVTNNNEVIPISNNTYSLGSATNVWNNAYINRINCDNIIRTVENSYIYMTAGPGWNNGASIFLNGKSGDGNGSGAGTFTLYARNTTAERYLLGRPDGILKWTGRIESQEFHSTTGNAFMAQNGSYTFLIRNDGSNTYLLMSDKDGVPGTWSTARPLIINNATGVCNINGYANTATYATTQAITDNSNRIATTAWVRNYVNSVAGSGSVGASISAYYSNATTKTAEGSSSQSGGPYPSDYSDYINISPTVGTIYTGSQLFSSLTPTASGTIFRPPTGSGGTAPYLTTAKATATFSGAFSSSAKYLCTTANAVRFRAYVSQGTNSNIGTASVVDNSSAKSIFIRVQ